MRKKLFAILMSAMMMVTFMPAMAFAAPDRNAGYDGLHFWVLDKDASVAATCTTDGLNVYKCNGARVGKEFVPCEETKTRVVEAGCDFQKQQIEIDAYYKAALEVLDSTNETAVKALMASYASDKANYCYGYADVCSVCGKVDLLTGLYDKQWHMVPSGTKICAPTFECKVCKQTIYNTNPKVAENHAANKLTWTKKIEKLHGVENYTLYEGKCDVCKQVVAKGVTGGSTPPDYEHKHLFTAYDTEPLAKAASPYNAAIEHDGQFYAVNAVAGIQTCSEDAPAAKGYVACECGKGLWASGGEHVDTPFYDLTVTGTTVTGAVAYASCVNLTKPNHTWTHITIEATCEHPGKTVDVCTGCGKVKDITVTDAALKHEVEARVVYGPTCERNGVTEVFCTKCGHEHIVFNRTDLGINTRTEGKIKIWKFEDQILDTPIVVDDPSALGHDFGKYEDMAAATCTLPGLQAQKCTKCGHYLVHTLKTVGKALGHDKVVEEVAATCEHKAGTITTCTRCDYRVVKGLEEIKGGKCTPADEWTTLVEPTFAKKGTAVKYCTKCGAICDSDDIAKLTLKKAYVPKLVAGSKKITVKVTKKTANATGYQIAYKAVGGNYKWVKTTNLSKTIKNLKKGTKYCFKIRAYAVEDGKTYYGAYCTVKYCKAK